MRVIITLWDKNSGIPAYNAIVWQDRRTEYIMKGMAVYTTHIGEKTGLRPDPYFSAGKIKWIIDNVEGIREKAENGDMAFGTVDSWIVYNLDSSRPYATDYTNASTLSIIHFIFPALKYGSGLRPVFSPIRVL